MSFAKELKAAADAIVPVLKGLDVSDRFLRFDGKPEVPARIFVPTQSDSKFQAEQALGDWAEDTLCNAINDSNAPISASHYGDNSKLFAEDEGFREEFKKGVIETFTYGKRADLLIFDRKLGVPADITGLSVGERQAYVSRSVGALEVRSSRLSSQAYVAHQKKRRDEGKKPSSLEPNFTVKVEDLVKVFLWMFLNEKPQAYAQVFFDDIYAIGFTHILEYVRKTKPLRVEKHDRSDKTTIMIPVSNGLKIGAVTAEPDFEVVHNRLQSGRHDIFARPVGGRMSVDFEAILEVLK